jgi:hypothetical protein
MPASTRLARVGLWCFGVAAFVSIWQTSIETASAAEPVRFVRDLVPALTKAGCNAGACHGSFQGRGGLQLSLLGYDPAHDYDVLFKDGRARRVSSASPEESLLLRKATGRMAHGGGKRFEIGSPTHRLLHEYIAQGMTPPEPGLSVVRLTVTPNDVRLAAGGKATLAVQAHWSDGIISDATPTALYDVIHDSLAEVTSTGEITAREPGRTTVNVRFCGQVAAVPLTIPFADQSPPSDFVPAGKLDELVSAEWKKLGVAPAPLASDEEFLRRIYLDLIGTPPTPDEIRAFLGNAAADKRGKLVDALLERPEYVDFWSLKWGDLLRAHRRYLGDKGLVSFRTWIRDAVRTNKPWDVMARELLTSQGNLNTNGPVAYYFIDEKLEDLTETTAQVFLGVRMQCTKCHHHPMEVWSQDDYYGLAAYFTRLETKDSGALGQKFGGPKSLRVIAKANPNRVLTRPAEPRMLGEAPPADLTAPDSTNDVRRHLAEWMTRPENPFFARSYVNRLWASMFGAGLVEPVDDLRATNPPTFPSVMEALTADFVAHKYDTKHTLRTICNSRTYQLASEINPKRDVDGRLCTHRVPRRLTAEVLLDAVNQAAGTQETFDGLPPGTRAIALPDPTIPSYFLNTFGRPLRNNPCDCARGSTPDLAQALHLVNSTLLHGKVTGENSRLGKLIKANATDEDITAELYLATFGRRPTTEETAAVKELVATAPNRAEGFQDILWTLLNSSEFVFNH